MASTHSQMDVSAQPSELIPADCRSKVALYAAGVVLGSALIGYFIGVQVTKRRAKVNERIKLSTDKVVDTVDMEDIGDKKVFCRCWKSEKVDFLLIYEFTPIPSLKSSVQSSFQFPYCDGSHNKHNAATGDNVGPLIIKKGE
ncbi:unnamed protein product [Anisakis simplex]|uniref:CDGSH iron-sulfur domain-containing protein 2 homologue n=1 Tax=Anisakis simplex TaxID=6269 RepID=A0A0M3JVG4_ANISI|nr:unnamed protein product [Anisakis simplex]